MPKFARSKAEMVVAGVIPIDRLTDMRAPVESLATRVGRGQAEDAYGLRLPPPPPHLPANTPPTAAQLLRAYALLRGWTAGSGLPDESRAGRQMLKDYTSGKLLNCTLPPGTYPPMYIPFVHDPVTLQPLQPPSAPVRAPAAGGQAATSSPQTGVGAPGLAPQASMDSVGAASTSTAGGSAVVATGQAPVVLDEADLDLLMGGELGGAGGGVGLLPGAQSKTRRADHKFHKKAARSKGTRGEERAEGGYDGAAMTTGRKGGLVRVVGGW